MSIGLPGPIAAYLDAKNAHDIDAMLAPFAENASVYDEGQEYHGRPAIRAWIEDVTTKYGVTVEVNDVTDTDGATVVTGLMSGNFPQSPLVLDFAFTLSGAKIVRLEIA